MEKARLGEYVHVRLNLQCSSAESQLGFNVNFLSPCHYIDFIDNRHTRNFIRLSQAKGLPLKAKES